MTINIIKSILDIKREDINVAFIEIDKLTDLQKDIMEYYLDREKKDFYNKNWSR